MKLSLWILVGAIVTPQVGLACGNEFNTAYEMTRHHKVQEDPIAFQSQVHTALAQCDHLIELRKEEKKSDALDTAYQANLQNCEDMYTTMKGYNEQEMAHTFCQFTAMRTYGWSVLAQALREEDKVRQLTQ